MIDCNMYTILTNLILSHYYENSRCLLFFRDNHSTFEYSGNIPSIQIKTNQNHLNSDLIFRYYGCQGIIIEAQNPVIIIQQFEELIRLNIERFNQRRYLILPTNTDECLANVEKIFEIDELQFISDILLIVPDKKACNEKTKNISNANENKVEQIIYTLKTHKYIGIENHNQSVILDYWFSKNQSFLYNSNLYPDKISNQYGRQLKMGTFTYEPYTIVGNTLEESLGSELAAVVTYAMIHNMTPTFVVNEYDYWGEIFENGSGNGLLGNLVDDNADIGFAALYTWEFCYKHLDLSKPLIRTGITCLVPAPKLAAGWLTPLFSYTTKLWIAVAVAFILNVVVMILMIKFYNNNRLMRNIYNIRNQIGFLEIFSLAMLIMYKPLLMQALTNKETPNQMNSKFLMLLISILCLFLTSTYSSGFASIMTIPRYENAIETVYDLAQSDIHWGATQDAWILSIENSEEWQYKELVRKFIATTAEDLRKFSIDNKFAFPIERLPFENFAIGIYIQDDIIGNYRLMSEDLYWEHCVIMTRKNSVLLPSIDAFILKILQAGLLSTWQNTAVQLFMDSNVQKAVKYSNSKAQEKNVTKLKWVHIEGAFAALILGYVISGIIFIFEIIIGNSTLKLMVTEKSV